MKEWTADFGNDPYDDYNLIVLIYYDDMDVAVIKQTPQGLEMKMYPSEKELKIPVEWLMGLLVETQRRMPSSYAKDE